MASAEGLHLTIGTALASCVALVYLILINCCCLDAQRSPMLQYFQILHSDEGPSGQTVSSSLENASKIVLLGSHKYDICCYVQPRDSQTDLQFDSSLFEERISNYRHRQSVSSCIHTKLSGLQLTLIRKRMKQTNNGSLSGTVTCRGLSSDGLSSIVGWFNYEISVVAQLTCNFADVLSAELSSEFGPIVFQCQLLHGWPKTKVRCGILDSKDGIDDSDVKVQQADQTELSNKSASSQITVELHSWQQYHGRKLVCRTQQACPLGYSCHGNLTANRATVEQVLSFRVRSTTYCHFMENQELGVNRISCNSTRGWPPVEHSCQLVNLAGESPLASINENVNNDSSSFIVSEFSTSTIGSAAVVAANTSIECVAKQLGFPEQKFSHVFVAVKDEATLSTASLDWAPIIVSLIILLVIILVILIMVAIAVRRRRQPASSRNGAGKT